MKKAILFLVSVSAILLIYPSFAYAEGGDGWPKQYGNVKISRLITTGQDSFGLFDCDSRDNRSGPGEFAFVQQGLESGMIAPEQESQVGCNIYESRDALSSSGTLYARYSPIENGHQVKYIAALKNGRVLWKSPLATDLGCGQNNLDDVQAQSINIGVNGNIYVVIGPASSPSSCHEYIASFNGNDGTQLFKSYLSNRLGTGRYSISSPQIWTYNNRVTVMDSAATIHEYTNSGIEDTAKRYSFPLQEYQYISTIMANKNGRVVAGIGDYDNPGFGSMLTFYHDSDGSVGQFQFPLSSSSKPNFRFGLSPNGHMYAYGNSGTLITYDIDSNTSSTEVFDISPGYDQATIANYWQDSDGSGILLRELSGSGQKAISVDHIDKTSRNLTNIFLLTSDTLYSANLSLLGSDLHDVVGDIYDHSLYLPVCNNCSAADQQASQKVYKISLSDFGQPIKDKHNFTDSTYEQNKKYVAMGDSYSSGEGVTPFMYGTAMPGVNECHRSTYAYPMLLEADTTLHVNMTNFVACAGATINNIVNESNVGNGELPQAVALFQDTDIVTLSIGGNDLGFGNILSTCTLKESDQESPQQSEQHCLDAIHEADIKVDSVDFRTALRNTYNSLIELGKANMRLIVVGYPQIFPVFGDITKPCTWGDSVGSTSGRPVSNGEMSAIRSVTAKFNALADDIVANLTNPNVSFVNPNSFFTGHELCTNDPWFHGALENVSPSMAAGSYHPNQQGQAAYYTAIRYQF